MMNYLQRDAIKRRLEALTEGPTPLLHNISFQGDFIHVHVQPWGGPMVLNYDQANAFTQGLDIPVRKPMLSETRQAAGARKAG